MDECRETISISTANIRFEAASCLAAVNNSFSQTGHDQPALNIFKLEFKRRGFTGRHF